MSKLPANRRARLGSGLALAGLLVLSLGLRVWRLQEIPPGFFIDEGAYGVDALRVLAGHHAPFFPTNYGREGLMIYAIAAAIELFGRTILAVRLPSALAGALAPFAVYWLAQIIFEDAQKPRKAQQIGLVAAALMIVSTWLVLMSRGTIRANFLMLLLPLVIGFLWQGIHRPSGWRMGVAGGLTGVLAYTYIAARFVPVFLLLAGLSFVLTGELNRRNWRRFVPGVPIFLGTALLVAAPLLVYFVIHPDHFLLRSQDLWVFQKPDALRLFLWNIGIHFAAFGFVADPYWRHSVAGMPILSLFEAAFFWLGLAIALVRWRQAPYRLLLIWLLVMMMPAFLAVEMSPNALRILGAAPAVFLLLALGVWEATGWAIERLPVPLATRRTAAWLLAAVVALLLTLRIQATWVRYFGDRAGDPLTTWNFYGEWRTLADSLNQIEDDDQTLYFIPTRGNFDDPYQPYHFDYLYRNSMPVLPVHTLNPPTAEAIYADIQSVWPVQRVEVVDWLQGMHWNGDAERRLPFLLQKYGRKGPRVDLGEYAVETYTDLSVAQPWTYAAQPFALDLTYDAGVTLRSAAFGAGGAGFAVVDAVDRSVTTEPGATLWIVTTWVADQRPSGDLKVSWRLVDEAGAERFQFDDTLVASDGLLSSEWAPAQVEENFHISALPPDLPSTCYALEMILYDAETLAPTVQVGVWEARYRLGRVCL